MEEEKKDGLKGTWSTENEMDFIGRLGTGKHSQSIVPRKKLLEGYLQGTLSREEWGTMDREKCLNYARECLAKQILSV